MEAIINKNIIVPSVTPEVTIKHGDEELYFSISAFGRHNFSNDNDVFYHINRYWREQDLNQQKEIFKLYKEIHYSYTDLDFGDDLTVFISEKCVELLDMHHIDTLHNWLSFKGNITIPNTFDNEHKTSIDNNITKEKTYIKKDYAALLSLSFVFKTLIPIWGEYISNTRKDKGNHFKELHAFQLIKDSYIMMSEPMIKLSTYIENISGESKNNPDTILKWVSSDDFIYWLMGLVCVRKISIFDISDNDKDITLITSVYKYIIQKSTRINDNHFEDGYKKKEFSNSRDIYGNMSFAEMYNIKTPLSPGEIVELEHSLSDIYQVARVLNSKITNKQINSAIKTSSVLLESPVNEAQIILLSWIFKPVISPNSWSYLSKELVVKCIAVLESVLWNRGHHYLALLSSSKVNISDRDIVISPIDSVTRVPADLIEELNKSYSFIKNLNNKTKQTDPSKIKQINIVTESIDILTDVFIMNSWRTTADKKFIKSVLNTESRKINIVSEIRILITKLVIQLGNRQYN